MKVEYVLQGDNLCRREHGADQPIWIDLLDPTMEEEAEVEAKLGFSIPTKADMADIEESARLYDDKGAAVMTAVVVSGVKEGKPTRSQVTFILTPDHLISVRYANAAAFNSIASTCERSGARVASSDAVMATVLMAIIANAAESLEDVGADLRDVSEALFVERETKRSPKRAENQLHAILRRLGRRNMAVAILRESLLSLERLLPYLRRHAGGRLVEPELTHLKQVERDVRSLSAHEAQLSLEIAYLHDASLGLINLDQTRIIKAFSIAAVLFLPPTLVGTVYGMNFKSMPELEWTYGYPLALALMVGSALLPYAWFRQRGWL